MHAGRHCWLLASLCAMIGDERSVPHGGRPTSEQDTKINIRSAVPEKMGVKTVANRDAGESGQNRRCSRRGPEATVSSLSNSDRMTGHQRVFVASKECQSSWVASSSPTPISAAAISNSVLEGQQGVGSPGLDPSSQAPIFGCSPTPLAKGGFILASSAVGRSAGT